MMRSVQTERAKARFAVFIFLGFLKGWGERSGLAWEGKKGRRKRGGKERFECKSKFKNLWITIVNPSEEYFIILEKPISRILHLASEPLARA